ncbi:MAG: DUF362 domain-containing protein [Promethearchaeota archaeon]
MSNDGHSQTCNSSKSRKRLWVLGALAIGSAFWLLIRSGTKPTRVYYPCQQTALTNIGVFKIALLSALPSLASIRSAINMLKPVGLLAVLLVGSAFAASDAGLLALNFTYAQDYSQYDRIPIELSENVATAGQASDIFLVQKVTGEGGNVELAISTLLDMMESEGLPFYNTSSSPSGIIESDDVVLLKINSQWPYRGGTNTDLVKSIIEAIISHPDGFYGEIIIVDNGQGLGSMSWSYANAFNNSQAMEDVAGLFPDYHVSTILWDNYRYATVDDYDAGDFNEGYVRSNSWDSETEIYTSYPKFTTDNGLYVSFKNGIWYNSTGFDSGRLKVINMPVLKTHFRYGVTGCIKHYMGVPQGYIVPSVDPSTPHEHFSIALGGMGTLMAETRVPVLNILDMIWVNAQPLESSALRGPWSRYSAASFTDIIGVSQDPVALDYWASKFVLIPTAEHLGFAEYSSLDPDYAPLSSQYTGGVGMDESFHNYLNRSRIVLADAGYQVTMDTDEMNVFVTVMQGSFFPPPGSGFQIDPLLIAVLIPVTAIIIVGVVFIMKKRMLDN